MLYLCIPAHDEAPTLGVLLWRIRKVFQEFSREYEILVFDDASTDATREVLAPYAKVLPLTVIGSATRVGYAGAVDALLRAASERTRYARRDAVVVMQGDFTDRPEHLPELVKRFEGGADVVCVDPDAAADDPEPEQQFRRIARWAFWPVRGTTRVDGVRDPFGSYRLLRVTVVRDLLKAAGDTPVSASTSVRVANLDLLRRVAALARRVDVVTAPRRWDLRPRPTRLEPWPEIKAVFRAAWAA
ncbi:MAG: glycosyltransferase family 2 protein, partial [Gemmatimonadaceae bacterium]|nr:glycosyltransferase family 2 protein [Gemmatimonadaceae bacterium]